MSDILIRGMGMPTEGGTIVVYKISGNYFAARAGKDELCPLVHVPPHGRLIDADALIKEHRADNYDYAIYATYLVQNAPTIISADGNMDTDFWGEEYAEAKGLEEEGE